MGQLIPEQGCAFVCLSCLMSDNAGSTYEDYALILLFRLSFVDRTGAAVQGTSRSHFTRLARRLLYGY